MHFFTTLEGYSLAQAKALTQPWLGSAAEARYDALFGKGVRRLYLPLGAAPAQRPTKSSTRAKVESVLNKAGYVVVNYAKGIAKKEDDQKNVFKVGRLLQRFDPKTKSEFDADPVRDGASYETDDLLVCLSRHPYDIGGASTGRNWTSCMDLEGKVVDGVYTEPTNGKKYLPKDIEHGTLVAYLIERSDTNLRKPLGRIFLKPYQREEGAARILYPESKIYGVGFPGFRRTLMQWCQKINALDNEELHQYHLHPELYNDSDRATVIPTLDADIEVLYALGNGFHAVKDVESDGLGVYKTATRSFVLPMEYTAVFGLNDQLFVGQSKKEAALVDANGKAVAHELDEVIRRYFVAENTLLFIGYRGDDSVLCAYAPGAPQVKEITTAESIRFYANGLVELRGDTHLDLYNAWTGDTHRTPLDDDAPLTFVGESDYGVKNPHVYMVRDAEKWYNLDTNRVEPALAPYTDGFLYNDNTLIHFTNDQHTAGAVYSLVTKKIIGNPAKTPLSEIIYTPDGVLVIAYEHAGLQGGGKTHAYSPSGALLGSGTKMRTVAAGNLREVQLWSKGKWVPVRPQA